MADSPIILSGKFQKVCFENDLSKKCAFYFRRHRLVNDGYGPGLAVDQGSGLAVLDVMDDAITAITKRACCLLCCLCVL